MDHIANAAPPAAATIDFPFEGELIFSPHYTARVTARDARMVEISIDGGAWQPCRSSEGRWWFDWSGYASGGHVLCARVTHGDGRVDALRPRAIRVALAPEGAPGLQEGPGVSSAISRALWSLRNQHVEFVQLWFTDVGGKPWRISLPVEHIDETAFTSGVTLDGPSTSRRFSAYITLLPDPGALFRDPLARVPTCALICDVLEPPEAGAAALGARQVLRSAVDALHRHEGLTAAVGAEPEFFLLDSRGRPAPEPAVWDFIYDLAAALGEAGIKSEGFRYGPARGQGRVQMRWASPVTTADNVVLYRWFAQVLAERRGMAVTFRPQPQGGTGAASMPVHHSLWAGVENVFHDQAAWSYFSDRGRWYAGGLLKHGAALAALTATTSGSYPIRAGAGAYVLRPHLSAQAPDAACRVPERMLNPQARRLKYRVGDGQANPYLALAGMLAAGLDGLETRTEPAIDGAEGSLPGTLQEALAALDADRDFLRRVGFTDRLLDAWITEKREQPDGAAIEG